LISEYPDSFSMMISFSSSFAFLAAGNISFMKVASEITNYFSFS